METPNIRQLSKFWHACSELCHVPWVLSSTVAEAQKDARDTLSQAGSFLTRHMMAANVWPVINHPPLIELRDRFIRGEATEEEVRQRLAKDGLWAQLEHSDGRKEFVGEPVAATPAADC